MKSLVFGVILGVAALGATGGYALECGGLPDCDDLGYTLSESDCEGFTFVRCPFNTSKVYCHQDCTALGYVKFSGVTHYCIAPKVKEYCPSDSSYSKCVGEFSSGGEVSDGGVAPKRTCAGAGYLNSSSYCGCPYGAVATGISGSDGKCYRCGTQSECVVNGRIICLRCANLAS